MTVAKQIERREIVFSEDRLFRYTLWRHWHIRPGIFEGPRNKGFVLFIALNPSTADERFDDPTIRRCIAFSKAWGYTEFCMMNLFAFRATQPEVMKQQKTSPVGDLNDEFITVAAQKAAVVVLAWGNHGNFQKRDQAVLQILKRAEVQPMCLRTTKSGCPEHPLYIPAVTPLKPFKT